MSVKDGGQMSVGDGFLCGLAAGILFAIAAGVAEYRLKSADGTETEFVWKKP